MNTQAHKHYLAISNCKNYLHSVLIKPRKTEEERRWIKEMLILLEAHEFEIKMQGSFTTPDGEFVIATPYKLHSIALNMDQVLLITW